MSDPPVAPMDDAGSDSASANDGSTEGGDGSAPMLLTCGLATQNPTPQNLGPVGMPDAGVPYKIDHERFAFVRLPDMIHVSMVAILSNDGVQNGNGTNLVAYTFDLSSSNKQPTKSVMNLAGNRIMWVGGVDGGVGILMWEQQAQQQGFTIYKVLANDLAAGKSTIVPTQSARVDVVTQPQVTECDGAALLPLGLDDYFLLSVVGSGSKFNFSARLKGGSPNVSASAVKTVDGYFYPGMVKIGNKVRVSSLSGNMQSVTTTELDFDLATAMPSTPIPVASDILVGAVPFGSGYATALVEGDLSTVSIKGVRAGTVPTPSATQPTGLALTALTPTELNLQGLAFLSWFTYDTTHSPSLLIAGSPPNGMGANFLWWDGNGVMHAKATGANVILKDKGTIAVIALLPWGTPTDTKGTFPVVFATPDANQVDTLWYGHILCTP